MRSLILILAIAIAFGAAAAWQSRKVHALREERARAAAIADGLVSPTPSGDVEAGWAVVTVGRSAGQPDARGGAASDASVEESGAAAQAALQAPDAAGDPTPAPEPEWSADWELTVEAGQSLSKIAAAHYGSAPHELLEALARYNHLASPDALPAGQRLKLPPLDLLLRN